MSQMQSRIIVVPSLEDLVDEFEEVLKSPSRHNVADTDAKIAVLGNVRAAFVNQNQIPIPTESSAARGAYVALQHAAERIGLLRVSLDGDLQPEDSDRLSDVQDADGRLNPMGLFEIDDLSFGLYPFAAIAPELQSMLSEERLSLASRQDAIALVSVEEALDWETWMDTFAR